jgi:hypothetical protein
MARGTLISKLHSYTETFDDRQDAIRWLRQKIDAASGG